MFDFHVPGTEGYRTELDQALRSGMQYALKAPTDGPGIASVIG